MHVRTMAHISNPCYVGKEEINIDVNRLFHQLAIVAERCDNVAGFFAFDALPDGVVPACIHAEARQTSTSAFCFN